MASKPKIIAIVGPTASGKTALSIEIAKKFYGEVISADSRQIYNGLDIGTGKVTTEEMAGVPHHLLDVVEPVEIYTAQNFLRDATVALKGIFERDRCPIIAGGTFFYIDLLRGNMQAAPVAPDPSFRDSLEKYTNEELIELLRTKDSRRAEDVDPNNRRRLIRALEIIETLGTVPKIEKTESEYDWLMIGIDIGKDVLRDKFSVRLTTWLGEGLLVEVADMRERLPTERFLELGFEYTLVADYIDKKITKDELYEKFVQKNWQYAKRQLTWLKRDKEIEWFPPENRSEIFRRIEDFLDNQ